MGHPQFQDSSICISAFLRYAPLNESVSISAEMKTLVSAALFSNPSQDSIVVEKHMRKYI